MLQRNRWPPTLNLPNCLVKIGAHSLNLRAPLQGPILLPRKWLEAIGLPIFEEQSRIALGVVHGETAVKLAADRNRRTAKLDCSFFLKWARLPSQSRPSSKSAPEESFNCKPSSMAKVGTLENTIGFLSFLDGDPKHSLLRRHQPGSPRPNKIYWLHQCVLSDIDI